jgi:class 3 adenylate cyclase
VNLAARMEEAADPGTVLITEDTHKLVARLFETQAPGPISVRGRSERIRVYRVLAARPAPYKVRGMRAGVAPGGTRCRAPGTAGGVGAPSDRCGRHRDRGG